MSKEDARNCFYCCYPANPCVDQSSPKYPAKCDDTSCPLKTQTGAVCEYATRKSSRLTNIEGGKKKRRYHLKCDEEESITSDDRQFGQMDIFLLEEEDDNKCGYRHSEQCKSSGGQYCDMVNEWGQQGRPVDLNTGKCDKNYCMQHIIKKNDCKRRLTKCGVCDEYAERLRELERSSSDSRFDNFYNNYNIDWHPEQSCVEPRDSKDNLVEC